MLPDPLKLDFLGIDGVETEVSTALSACDFAITDVSPGRTVRRCASFPATGMPATLTISHNESSENKPTKTDRTLIRLDAPVKGPDGVELKEYISVQFTRPRIAKKVNGTSDVEHIQMFGALIGFLLSVSTTTPGVTEDARLERLLALEP